MIRLAGIPLPASQVIELALLLRRHDFAYTADRLEAAVATREPDVALTSDDREAILHALHGPFVGLEKLRAALLQDGRPQAGT